MSNRRSRTEAGDYSALECDPGPPLRSARPALVVAFPVAEHSVFVNGRRALECNLQPICDGTKVAAGPPVEPRQSNEQLSIDWTSEETGARTPAPPVAPVEAARPGGFRVPLILVAIVGTLAGGIAVLAFVNVGAAVPAETAPAVVAAPAPPPAAFVETTPPPTWDGRRRAGWATDGTRTITFHLAATRYLPVWMNHARPELVIRCVSRVIDAFVILDTSASFEDDADRRTVRVQWDDEAPSVQQWGVSEGGRELFAPNSGAFMERMATARRLQFGFTPFNAEPVTADFAVQGFDQLKGLVTSTC